MMASPDERSLLATLIHVGLSRAMSRKDVRLDQ